MRRWINLVEHKDTSVEHVCWIGNTPNAGVTPGYFIVGDADEGLGQAKANRFNFTVVFEARFQKILWLKDPESADPHGIYLRFLIPVLNLTDREYGSILHDQSYYFPEDQSDPDDPWVYGVDLQDSKALQLIARERGYDAIVGSNTAEFVIVVLDPTRLTKVEVISTSLGRMKPIHKPGALF